MKSIAIGPGELSIRHLVGYQIVELTESDVRFTMDLMTRWLQRTVDNVAVA
jgi:hypothetical protein